MPAIRRPDWVAGGACASALAAGPAFGPSLRPSCFPSAPPKHARVYDFYKRASNVGEIVTLQAR